MRLDVVKNIEIFYTLKEELSKAESEIIVVTAWFTDSELLRIIEQKLQSGVAVKILISDNVENERINFASLIEKGAVVTKVKQDGKGMMHQKFCVIDSKLAIHGSYNWTVNARNNNQESVIVTDHRKTIKTLKKSYKELVKMNTAATKKGESLIKKWFGANFNNNERKSENHTDVDESNENKQGSSAREFEQFLNEIIESEVFDFNKDQMINKGYERAKATNGDHQFLPNTLETLYADLINSLDIAQDKKESIKTKIEEIKNLNISRLQQEKELELHVLESEMEAKKAELEHNISVNNENIKKNKIEIENIKNNEIASLDDQIRANEEEIGALQVESEKTKLRWHELIPAIILSVFLFAYIVIFYSSAGYIILYSRSDAELDQMQGNFIIPAEVFDYMAISKAFEKGGTAPFFLFLFIFIPLTLALLDKLTRKKIWEKLFWVLVIFLDFILAYKVARSIYEVDYLAGRIDEQWSFGQMINENFFLVFAFGALGLVLFKLAFGKIYESLDERTGDSIRAKIKNLKNKTEKIGQEKRTWEGRIAEINKKLVELDSDNTRCNRDIGALPVDFKRKSQHIQKSYDARVAEIENIVVVYDFKIENKDFKFPSSALKDRVNTFLEGWVNYLHETYSVKKAKEMSADASNAKDEWLNTKLKLNSNLVQNLN